MTSPNLEQVEAKLKEIIASQLGVNVDDLKPEAKFTDDFSADSLDMVEISLKIETEFNIEVPDEEVANLQTVGDVLEFVKNKLNEG
ncbi:MAG: acyl carrier protein [Lentisphaerae bacterium]|nr:MAG: acyl carrier protein [Lentisphaerota bacterium]